jgi:hypothetical protein
LTRGWSNLGQEGDMTAISASIGYRLGNIFCRDPDVQDLSPEQLAALHVCKHEIIASVFKVYMVVPQNKADKIFEKFFKDVPLPKPH